MKSRRRDNKHNKLYGRKWKKARKAFLILNPLCVDCKDEGTIKPATEVDHKIAHKGALTLFWDKSNWQGLCKPHHSRKTVKEDGGFGR